MTTQQPGSHPADGGISLFALAKGEERYVFIFDDASRAEVMRTLGRFASNPSLSFTWYDAAVLLKKLREAEKAREGNRGQLGNTPGDSSSANDSGAKGFI